MEEKRFRKEITNFLDAKIEQLKLVNELETAFLTSILYNLVDSKINASPPSADNQSNLKDICNKINIILDNVLYFSPDNLQSIEKYLLRVEKLFLKMTISNLIYFLIDFFDDAFHLTFNNDYRN